MVATELFLERRRTGLVVLSVGAVAALLVLHYGTTLHALGLHDLLRRLFYLPVIISAIAVGTRGGLLVAGLASAGFLPHLRQLARAGDRQLDLALELLLLLAIGALVGAFADASRRARALAAERGRLAALGETGFALMAQAEGPLAAMDGQAESLAFFANRTCDGAVGFAAGVIRDEVARVRRLFGDLRGLGAIPAARPTRVDLAWLVSGIVRDIRRGPGTGQRLSLGRVAGACSVEADRRTLAFGLRSLLFGLLEAVRAPGWLEVGVLDDGPGAATIEIGAFTAGGQLPDLERGLTGVFGAAVADYRFGQVLCVRLFLSLGADVQFHRSSPGEALVRVRFRTGAGGHPHRARPVALRPESIPQERADERAAPRSHDRALGGVRPDHAAHP